MTLIVEDGTGRDDAESLASVDQVGAHHESRGNSRWATLTETEKEQALRRATDYMGQMYAAKWKGVRAHAGQALDWPRADVRLPGAGCVPSDAIPKQITQAMAELALRAAAGELAPDLGRTVAEKTIGPIKTVYAAGAPEYVRYRSIELLLQPLLGGGGLGIRLERT
jgi:hypothetical protein